MCAGHAIAALAGAFRAGLVLLALGRAAESAESIEPWLALALVERFVAGVHAHLRLLAAYPGVSVPDDVLPAEDRLDLARIFERHARARAHADRSYEAARARCVSARRSGSTSRTSNAPQS